MLIEFSVTNFRSIKEEVCLSLVASRDKKHGDSNVVEPKLAENGRPIWLLRSAAIYGANASGKTNLLRGLKTMQDIVLHSSDRLDELPVTPFRFDPECHTLPTSFEVVCVADGVRYQYGFSATPHEVTDEWLYAWPSGRMQVWFERSRSETSGEPSWKFGRKLAGDREVWRRATRPQALFLSTAVSLNSTQLLPLFNWFRDRLHVASLGGWGPTFSLEYCNKNQTDIVDFLTAADLAVTDIRIVEEDFSPEMFPELKDLDEKFPGEKTIVDVFLRHQPKGGKSAELEMAEESHGTQKMFALAGPWLDSLDKGNVIVFDELHDNLHPALVRFLINHFHDPEANPYGAQLVFATHDTSILDRDMFRPDQIWFCERNEHLETRLFPLSDFRLRRGVEDLEKAYLAGRFGALPYIRGAGRQPSD
ncbi:MAG: ATP-binding protein [Gemmatimonadota bacterium]|nr:ATP-binding protein [Gemmatimonadota bacterium]